ncbi:hypothetical protein P9112_006912 [Eukaryota sp. TZLM1-RC]
MKPRKRNVTRWLSLHDALQRYFDYKELKMFDLFEDEVTRSLPSPAEERNLQRLLEALKKVQPVTKYLQRQQLSLAQAESAFEEFHKDFPNLTNYTSYPSQIMHSPNFETAVSKLQRNRELELSYAEKEAVQCFLKCQSPTTEEDMEVTFEERMRRKEECDGPKGHYIDLGWIPATRNDVERLFSRAKMTMADRPNLTSDSLEKQLFLYYNKHCWDQKTVELIMSRKANNGTEDN